MVSCVRRSVRGGLAEGTHLRGRVAWGRCAVVPDTLGSYAGVIVRILLFLFQTGRLTVDSDLSSTLALFSVPCILWIRIYLSRHHVCHVCACGRLTSTALAEH